MTKFPKLMRNLPEDVLFSEILPKLPPKSLARFKCVSKTWNDRISNDPSFIKSQLNHQLNTNKVSLLITNNIVDSGITPVAKLSLISHQNTDTTTLVDMTYITDNSMWQIVGSCHGLICLQFTHFSRYLTQIVLWNPSTRQFRLVQEGRIEKRYNKIYSFGLGFDENTHDYKIIRLFEVISPAADEPLFRARVFSRNTGLWRWAPTQDVEKTGFSGVRGISARMSGVVADGSFHWLGHKTSNDGESGYCIVSFDLRDEVLKVSDEPGESCLGANIKLCNWKGSLGAFVYKPESECSLWIASSEKNVLCWRKLFQVMAKNVISYKGVWRNKIIVKERSEPTRLALFDPITGEVKTLNPNGSSTILVETHEYVESLVSVF